MPSPTITSLPQKLILKQGPSVPVPRHYNLTVGASAGFTIPNRANIAVFYGEASSPVSLLAQETVTVHGLNQFAYALALYAAQNSLWGKAIPCIAVAMGGALGTQYVARSNAENVTLPTAPCTISNPFLNTAWGSSDSPNPLRLAAPGGRRLYFASDPSLGASTVGRMWYVTPDNRLETSAASRGFDRFTFWLSLYAVAIKDSVNVTSGETLAPLLGAYKSNKLPMAAPLGQLVAAAGPNANAMNGHLMWTGSRVIMIRASGSTLKVREWTTQGDSSVDLSSWITSQNQNEVWNVRMLLVPVTPKFGNASIA